MQVRLRRTWVLAAPRPGARRLGEVRRGARMRTAGLVPGRGCAFGYYRLVRGGFLCGDGLTIVPGAPGGVLHPAVPPGRVLPYRYVAVGPDGSAEYLEPADAASDYFLRELGPRHAVSVVGRVRYDGVWFWRTTRGTYVPAAEAVPVRASRFAGLRLGPGQRLPVAFVHRRRARIYRRPGRLGRGVVRRYARFVDVTGRCGHRRCGGGTGRRCAPRCGWIRIGPQRWLRRRDVRLAQWTARPPGVAPGERWIDVDLSEQVLVAYQGDRPRFATLVSTGKHGRTPTGRFRVWVKLAATDMKSDPDAAHPYWLWDVPWTQFFRRGVALHGTYWHDGFGFRRSAGCVNLSPLDARFLFSFTRPEMPPGWWAVLPRRPELGTLVQVRRGGAARGRGRGRRRGR